MWDELERNECRWFREYFGSTSGRCRGLTQRVAKMLFVSRLSRRSHVDLGCADADALSHNTLRGTPNPNGFSVPTLALATPRPYESESMPCSYLGRSIVAERTDILIDSMC
jgi:hypothetical protein